jgi:hypothetical protein
MTLLIQILVTVSILANGVIYGVDVFAALVQRTVLTFVDDAALTSVVGHGHRIADKRFPPIGISGLVSAVLAAVAAGIHGRTTSCVAAVVAALALVIWLGIFARVSSPVNKALTAAAVEGRVPDDARALQATWDSVINVRVVLQTVALITLCVALAAAA